MLPGMPREARGDRGLMRLMLITVLPIEWTRHACIAEAMVYSVEGLRSERRTLICMRPGGWRIIRETLVEFDQGRLYSSADEAAAALKAWIEGGDQTTKAGD